MSAQDSSSIGRSRIRKELLDELDELRGGDIQRIARRLSQVDGRKRRLVAIGDDGCVALIKHLDALDYGIYAIGAGGTLSQRDQVGAGKNADTILEEHAETIDWVAPEWQ